MCFGMKLFLSSHQALKTMFDFDYYDFETFKTS